MAKKPRPEAAHTREAVYDAARDRLAELYSYLKTAAYDPGLPLTPDDRAAFKRQAKRASALLEDVRAQRAK